jgi:hypothetical protein
MNDIIYFGICLHLRVVGFLVDHARVHFKPAITCARVVPRVSPAKQPVAVECHPTLRSGPKKGSTLTPWP